LKDLFKNLPTLYTDRLILRKVKKYDINKLYTCLSNEYVTQHMLIDFNKSIDSTHKFLNTILNGYKDDKPTPWAIALKENNKLIGVCGFSKYDEANNKAEVGYLLNYDYWNKGITTEALKRVMDFGFNNMKLTKIEARCISENLASEKVMIKSGMKLDKMIKNDKIYKGNFVDLKLYSALKSDIYK
jgi:[ribosomal protein S5]-alanine N-acetyltransferase